MDLSAYVAYGVVSVITVMLINWLFVKGQLMMKTKIARQINWGIKNGRIKLEVDGNAVDCDGLYGVICSKDYPQK